MPAQSAPMRFKKNQPIDELTHHPANPRQGDVGAIATSIEHNGFFSAIVVQESTGHILAGNHRVKAAAASGMTTVPAIFVDVDDQQAVNIMLADNRTSDIAINDDHALADLLKDIASRGDDALLPTGFDHDDLDQLLADLSNDTNNGNIVDPKIADAEEAAKRWGVATGDIFTGGGITLTCGDSTKAPAYKILGERSIDLTFTSFPYGVGIDYGEDQPPDTLENVRQLLSSVVPHITRHTTPGGYCITNFNDIISARTQLGTTEVCEYPMALEYWTAFYDQWMLHTRRIWAKPHARVASLYCANSNRAAPDWEHLWTWKLGAGGLNDRKGKSALGVWDTSNDGGVDIGKSIHGAGMPVALPVLAIDVYTNAGDVVFDPFVGTGTTLLAAAQLDRPCFGIEIEPKNVAITLDRLSQVGFKLKRI